MYKKRARIPVVGRIRWEFQFFKKIGQNSNVCSGKIITLPMFLRIGQEFQCLDERDHNSNAYRIKGQNCIIRKDEMRIPVFGRIR